MAENAKATEAREMDDLQALEVALELLRPLGEMHDKVLENARSVGIVIGPNEPVPIYFPYRQVELVSVIEKELKDGLEKGGWSQAEHPHVFKASEQLQRIEQSEKGNDA